MSKEFEINASLNAMSDAFPIRFSHNRTHDNIDKHVLHINNYVEIYVFVSGDHRYIVENSVYDLKRGDIVIINPREVHKALPLGEGMYERFYFLVDENAFGTMHLDPLRKILNKPKNMGNLVSFDEKTRKRVLEILYEISGCFSDGRNDQLVALGCFMRILAEIERYFENSRVSENNMTHAPELLKKILAYVAEHASEIESTTEISASLGLSPQYLSSYFSKYVGTPLKTYIQAKKIAYAKDLLDRGADVTSACYECGFNDCSYFIKIFKKYVGVTPFVYKKG